MINDDDTSATLRFFWAHRRTSNNPWRVRYQLVCDPSVRVSHVSSSSSATNFAVPLPSIVDPQRSLVLGAFTHSASASGAALGLNYELAVDGRSVVVSRFGTTPVTAYVQVIEFSDNTKVLRPTTPTLLAGASSASFCAFGGGASASGIVVATSGAHRAGATSAGGVAEAMMLLEFDDNNGVATMTRRLSNGVASLAVQVIVFSSSVTRAPLGERRLLDGFCIADAPPAPPPSTPAAAAMISTATLRAQRCR
mmetsp:Transcript_43406/g.106569  ORF Transcript_43406/g.106569 Transcript_43406/m.106569 type:complete len:252 (-) Transcript_43406:279-1034(-)